jgi:hypothetical protein
MGQMRDYGIPFGVIHNHDNPPVARPMDYPSFAWTQLAFNRLEATGHDPQLVRQPVLPRFLEPKRRLLHLGTFGHVEPKKWMAPMAGLARRLRLPFTAVAPTVFAERYQHYIRLVEYNGGEVKLHEWVRGIEDLAPLVEDISHFLFVLPPSKDGTGGSCTSPRWAPGFGRPVVVIDDEDTFKADGVYVFRKLLDITREQLVTMQPPNCEWTPDAYVDALVEKTLAFWRNA